MNMIAGKATNEQAEIGEVNRIMVAATENARAKFIEELQKRSTSGGSGDMDRAIKVIDRTEVQLPSVGVMFQ